MNDNMGDTAYFASTDYNQRLEEKAENNYLEKNSSNNDNLNQTLDTTVDEAIKGKDTSILTKMASSSSLSDDEYMKLILLGNKDIHINLARNEYISNTIAEKLIGTVHLAHIELYNNKSISSIIKNKLIDYLKNHPSSSSYINIIESHNTDIEETSNN